MTGFRVMLCILAALLLHALIMLFGGWFFMRDGEQQASRSDVQLVAEDVEKDQEKNETTEPEEKPEEIEASDDAPPDPEQVAAATDAPASSDDAPALDAASLAAIEAALSGGGAASGGDSFGAAASLASGGRIGGTGKAGSDEEELQGAFSMSEIDQRPRAVYQVAAGYPASLRSQKLEGLVTVIFIVDDSGRVVSPRVERASHPDFEAPALDAIRQWKFEPAIRAGKRVSCRMRVPIRFQPR